MLTLRTVDLDWQHLVYGSLKVRWLRRRNTNQSQVSVFASLFISTTPSCDWLKGPASRQRFPLFANFAVLGLLSTQSTIIRDCCLRWRQFGSSDSASNRRTE